MPNRPTMLLTLALLLTGCDTWVPTRLDPVDYIQRERPSWIRVSLRDGEQRRIRRPTVRDGAIVDARARCTRTRCEDSIDPDDVTLLEGRELSVGKTVVVVGAVLLVGFALLFGSDDVLASG